MCDSDANNNDEVGDGDDNDDDDEDNIDGGGDDDGRLESAGLIWAGCKLHSRRHLHLLFCGEFAAPPLGRVRKKCIRPTSLGEQRDRLATACLGSASLF